MELGLIKIAKLVEEYERRRYWRQVCGDGTAFHRQTWRKLFARDSGYYGSTYSQDRTAFANETSAVGHSVRAMYFYTGATDVWTFLPDDNETKQTYMNTLSTIWDAVENRKTYITGGIGTTAPSSDSKALAMTTFFRTISPTVRSVQQSVLQTGTRE